MGLFDGILGAIAGPIVGGLFGMAGQQQANEQNLEISRENNSFNADQAGLNRDFQSQQINAQQIFNADEAQKTRDFQSNARATQYQTAVGDMQAAGLNPMLAYSQGGAGNISGATATSGAASGSQASSAGNPRMESSLGAGLATAQMAANIQKTSADTDVSKAQKDLLIAQTGQTTASAGNLSAQTDKTISEIEEISSRISLQQKQRMTEDFKQILLQAQATLTDNQRLVEQGKLPLQTAQTFNTQMDSILKQAQTDQQGAQTQLTHLLATHSNLDLNRAENESKMEGTSFGAAKPYIDQTGKILNSAGAAARNFIPQGKVVNIFRK